MYTKMKINIKLSAFSIFGQIMSKHVCVKNENSGLPTFERDHLASNYRSLFVFSPVNSSDLRFLVTTIYYSSRRSGQSTLTTIWFYGQNVVRHIQPSGFASPGAGDFRTRTIIAKTWTVCVCANLCRDACRRRDGRSAVS